LVSQQVSREVVVGAWSSCFPKGWMGFVVGEKLKMLKKALKGWNKEVCGDVYAKN